MSLTVRIVDRVESVVLGVELVKMVRKLREALKSGFVEKMETYGAERVKILVTQAVEWGYQKARSWVQHSGFVGFLTVLDSNWPQGGI